MGVTGLWQLLDPTGKPVRLETLEGKILAIDISIWLNQFVKGYRGGDGAGIENSHLVGLFQRICKLLHYKIRPVFVFDGQPPALKYQTLATRKRKKDDSDIVLRSTTKRLLEAYVQQKLLGEANPKLPKVKPTRQNKAEENLFKLPNSVVDLSASGNESSEDDDDFEDADLRGVDVESEEFKALPPEMQHELLIILKERDRESSVTIEELPVDGDDFCNFQMNKVLRRSAIQKRINEVRRVMNDTDLIKVASDSSVRILHKLTSGTSSQKDSPDEASPIKKPKIEEAKQSEENSTDTPKNHVEKFLVSQWLQGAQQGDMENETLKKAAELVRDVQDKVVEMSDSGASSDSEEADDEASLTKPHSGGKISAEMARKLHRNEDVVPKEDTVTINSTSDSTKDSMLDAVSMEVGHGSIVSVSTPRMIQPGEEFDEASNRVLDDDTTNDVLHDNLNEDETCNTDVLNADLEVSETGNSLFKLNESNTGAVPSTCNQDTQTSAGSCKLTEITGSPVLKEVSFLGGAQSTLNSNDDIVLPQNLSRYASVNPSRNNSNSCHGDLSGPQGSSSTSAEPTDFHQALEIIKEQERRMSECVADGEENITEESDIKIEDVDRLEKTSTPCPLEDTGSEVSPTKLIDKQSDFNESKNEGTSFEDLDAPLKYEETSKSDISASDVSPAKSVSVSRSPVASSSLIRDSSNGEALALQSQHLVNEIHRIQRQSESVSNIMIGECKDLLSLFGIPFVRSPSEAEAQCAALEKLGLVQGTVTDDSDIFLFGGQTVYRNFFSQDQHCEVYTSSLIESRLKMSRFDMIGFALLTGSDYTLGIENVGPVTACEILAEFRCGTDVMKALREFKKWWSDASKGSVPPMNSTRARFLRLHLNEKFPSNDVFEAYVKPNVDLSEEKFSWARPDLDALRSFASEKFKWGKEKTDGFLLPIMKRFDEKTLQPRIDGFLLPSIEKKENLFPSKRLKAAVGKLKSVREANLSESSSDSEKE